VIRPNQVATDLVGIAGAGPVGTLMAILLARRGRSVQVFERRADPRLSSAERGRSINLALAARGLRALERADALARIAPEMVLMKGRQLHASDGTQSFLPYGSREQEVIYSISRARLNTALIEAASTYKNIKFSFDTRCSGVEPSNGRLFLQDRSAATRSIDAALLIAADGAGSALRAALCASGDLTACETPLAHDYKEFLIEPRAGSWALEAHALHIWPRGGFMLIALPNADGSFTGTLFLARTGTPSFEALRGPSEVEEFFAREFPDVPPLLPQLAEQFKTHPQGHLATLECRPWSAGDCVLIGDAAHAILPFHGQGLNCGFEDCLLLDELLATQPDTRVALKLYEQGRRSDTEAIAAMALENYQEMRDTVQMPDFARRRALSLQLEQLFPKRFIPRYSMVMFHAEIPYAEAQRRGALQEKLLDGLLAREADVLSDRGALEKLLTSAGL
jgi:kynurenine 3-monooxygenase